MTTDDVIRLSYQQTGVEAINLLRAQLEQLQRGVADTRTQMLQGTKTTQDYENAVKAATPDLERLNLAMRDIGRTAGANGSAGRMIEFSRALQDFQAAGIMGVVNNLEGIARSLGMAGGVAGAATIAGVVLQQFWPQIREFFTGTATEGPKVADALDKIKKALEEVSAGKYGIKVDAQQAEQAINTLNAMQRAIQAARATGGAPGVVGESKSRIEAAVAEFGGFNEQTGEMGQENLRKVTIGLRQEADRELSSLRAELAKVRKDRDALEAALKQIPLGDPRRQALEGQARGLDKTMADLDSRAQQRQGVVNQRAETLFGGFTQGIPGPSGEMLNFMQANRNRFLQSGVNPQLFPALQQAMPGAIRADQAETERIAELDRINAKAETERKGLEAIQKQADDQADAARKRSMSAEARANAQAAAQQGAVLQAGMAVPLDAQLAGGANPFQMAEGLAAELSSQGVEKNAAMEQAAKMVEQAIQQVKMANAEQNATIMGMLNSLSQGLGSIATQQQGFTQQSRRMQQSPMGRYGRNR